MLRMLVVLGLLVVLAGCSTPTTKYEIPPAGADSSNAAPPDTTLY